MVSRMTDFVTSEVGKVEVSEFCCLEIKHLFRASFWQNTCYYQK